MKKLFLQSGKLWVGEFPEEPEDMLADPWKEQAYNKQIQSAKDSAVEVVNRELIADVLLMQEGQLYDVSQGWTVEIGYQYKPDPKAAEWTDCHVSVYQDYQKEDNKKFGSSRKIARLIPLKEQSSGIVAVGVPEYGEPEKTDHTMKCNVCGELFDRSNLTSVILHEHDGKEEIAAQALGIKGKKVEAVINLEALKRICYHFAGIVAPGWQPNAGSAFDSEWDEWLSTGKIVDWHQHPDDSKEVVKVEDLTRKP